MGGLRKDGKFASGGGGGKSSVDNIKKKSENKQASEKGANELKVKGFGSKQKLNNLH